MTGQRRTNARLSDDPYLSPFLPVIERRHSFAVEAAKRIGNGRPIEDAALGHLHFGLHGRGRDRVLREWAPNASSIHVIGDFSGWREVEECRMRPAERPGEWELVLPRSLLPHGSLYRLRVRWNGGEGDRIPSYATRVVQDPSTLIFNAQVWDPPAPYEWRNSAPPRPDALLIYESHPGMAQEKEGVGSFDEFRTAMLPRIAEVGYNTVQMMAVMEHPYYGSFGYHVSNFFAVSSRFGTPDDFRRLVDDAHGMGLRVIIDLIHSHAAPNAVEGLALFDGTRHQYFHAEGRGLHPAWGSLCFDYARPEVVHFLLSNCRFWLEEYRIDGFRFDGVTSMLYLHHGFGPAFDSYDRYFDASVDEDALTYLALANRLIHSVRPDAVTIAEDVSGMPGLAAPWEDGGCGFDYRLAMGIPDMWFKLARDVPDENWNVDHIWRELTNRRPDEQVISYVESHDQALVGGKSMAFQLMDEAMYRAMRITDEELRIDRGMALHKLMRLATLASASHGYLNFMGNEFGHPEWIDFPREGNNWSYRHARRLWSLRSDPSLRFHFLADFDRDLLRLITDAGIVGSALPQRLPGISSAGVIAFGRRNYFFILNFHPSVSYPDLPVELPPGSYRLVFDTDSAAYGGHGRVNPGQQFASAPSACGSELRHCISVYLPCRTGLVLVREMPARGMSR
ncbi:MAG: 1,4-alpha-glucan-branching enzyme [Lentisphaerae bacterium]|nr:1,4-alpha-glucan-branching enzyme [Lentisphaerota bacterium]